MSKPVVFYKYHALGNDYLVTEAEQFDWQQTTLVQAICHRHFGIGADGILVNHPNADGFKLRIINPDGSLAEKSGNGLRIYSRYLYDQKRVADAPFDIQTDGGIVRSQILQQGEIVRVDMGAAEFNSTKIPISNSLCAEGDEVILQDLIINNRRYQFSAVSMGNPHCVILVDQINHQQVLADGAQIERHHYFPNRTNVQFVSIEDRHTIKVEIWERGAGYTLASGSSASAAAAICYKLGKVDSNISVQMPGGNLSINIQPNWHILMQGPVAPIGVFHLHPDFAHNLPPISMLQMEGG